MTVKPLVVAGRHFVSSAKPKLMLEGESKITMAHCCWDTKGNSRKVRKEHSRVTMGLFGSPER